MDEFELRVIQDWHDRGCVGPYPHFSGSVVGNVTFDSGRYFLPDPPEKLGNKKLREKWIEECREKIKNQPTGARRGGMKYCLHSTLYYSNYTRIATESVTGL